MKPIIAFLVLAVTLISISVSAQRQIPPKRPKLPVITDPAAVCIGSATGENAARAQVVIGTNGRPEVVMHWIEAAAPAGFTLDSVQDVALTRTMLPDGIRYRFSVFRPANSFTGRPDALFEGDYTVHADQSVTGVFTRTTGEPPNQRVIVAAALEGCIVWPGELAQCQNCLTPGSVCHLPICR